METLYTIVEKMSDVWLSILMLVFIYLLKYFLNKKATLKDVEEFLLEFPIDLCTVGISLILTLGFSNIMKVPFGIKILVSSFIIIMIGCLLRRFAIYEMLKEEPSQLIIGVLGCVNIIISFFYMGYVILRIV